MQIETFYSKKGNNFFKKIIITNYNSLATTENEQPRVNERSFLISITTTKKEEIREILNYN
jgi:hypothetical protein